jgi:fatty acid desaturase
MSKVLGPYLAVHFFLLPAPLLFLGKSYFFNAMKTLVAAELLTNAHAFLAIATNHCGDDLYRFSGGCKPRSPTFYLRQVVSSANYPTGANRWFGADVNDFLHGWLNYQVEHHMWPELSALSYQKAQPEVKVSFLCVRPRPWLFLPLSPSPLTLSPRPSARSTGSRTRSSTCSSG